MTSMVMFRLKSELQKLSVLLREIKRTKALLHHLHSQLSVFHDKD